jgi:hypothetical protein
LAEEEIDRDLSRLKAAKITMLVSLLVVFVGGTFAVMQVLKPAQSLADKVASKIAASQNGPIVGEDSSHILTNTGSLIYPAQALRRMGATADEVAQMKDFSFTSLSVDKSEFDHVLSAYVSDPKWFAIPWRRNVPSAGFAFPTNILIGAISIEGAKPIYATGFVPAPPGKSACLYLSRFARGYPEILKKFGPRDLTGLEVSTDHVSYVIQQIKNWSRLKELCFFNVLLKAMPGFEMTDESDLKDSDLPALEQLTGLRSLGICGPGVTGRAILAMPMLKKLETIKLKRVKDIDPLLEALPALDNIKEVWLIGQGTTDQQVETLSNMKNLTTLKIMRSNLTPASLKCFREMSALKHLTLDRNNWTESEKSKFKSGLSGCVCEFEPLMDPTYWRCLK